MADLEALEREIRSSPAAETLKNAADSPEGRRVLEKLDTAKVSEAAQAGDMQALKSTGPTALAGRCGGWG